MKPLIIIGAGGYAQELLWIVDDINLVEPVWEFLGFVDPAAPEKKGAVLYDRPVLGGYGDLASLPKNVCFACGIGNPQARAKECLHAEGFEWTPTSLLHPSVVIARHVEIGPGTIVGAGSILAPCARIGRHCAINVHVTVGHNSVINDFSVVSPGARISGYAVLESETFIGSNACIFPGKRVGARSRLASNSFLVTDLPPDSSVMGVPARAFRPEK